MNRVLSSVVLAGLALAAGGAAAQTAITHPAITLSTADLRDIYLGEKQFAGAVKLVPVDNASAQEKFLASFVKVDVAKYGSVWAKKAFREGLTQPAAKATDSEVVDFVKKTPGAVGYVGDASKAVGVNVVK